jgi:hypothetical protein
MFAQHHPGEQHAQRRHHEMIGTRGHGTTHFQEMEPQHEGKNGSTQHEEQKRTEQFFAGHDVMDVGEGERDRRQHDSGGEILDAVADPETALRRQQLEENGAGHDGGERSERQQDAVQAVGPHRHAVPDDSGDARDPQQQPQSLAPGQRFLEEDHGDHLGEHGIAGHDQAAQTGGHRYQPGIAEPEIKRVVGDAKQREHPCVAKTELPRLPTER